MARRLHKTLIDYLVIAINPALIMTLIGSLVFFLIEVLYQGQFEGRLRYIFVLFIFAAVLVGRIAVEEGKAYARLFALPLGVATFLALERFVEYQGAGLSGLSWAINAMLILLILWCADKLVWDCTLIDETQRDSGKGLLQLAGLDKPRAGAAHDLDEPQDNRPEGTTSREQALLSWWQRLLERQRRPHAPGVWVVYFSLAALPLFGIGELLTPPESPAVRRALFFLLIYVASGLGLLLTTSFLGLRRYLRQRRVEMPTIMASVWLVIGCTLIVAVLVFAALLPRPGTKYAISHLLFDAGSEDQTLSRYATGSDGVEADQGELHSDQPDPQGQSASADRNGEDGSDCGEQSGQGEGKPRQLRGEGHSQPGQNSEPEGRREGPGADSPDRPQRGPDAEQTSSSHRRDMEHASPSRREDIEMPSQMAGRAAADQNGNPRSETQPPRDRTGKVGRQAAPRPQNLRRPVNQEIVTLLRWIFYGVILLIGVYWLWRSRAEVLAALQGLLQGWREFWQKLFGGGREPTESAGTDRRLVAADGGLNRPSPRPFAAFADPFASGAAGRYSADELVRYSFEALEAWAREHGCPRQPQQTPHEFARHLGARVASLSRHVRSLADLYCRVAYAPGRLPSEGDEDAALSGHGESVGSLKELWQQLQSGTATGTAAPGQ